MVWSPELGGQIKHIRMARMFLCFVTGCQQDEVCGRGLLWLTQRVRVHFVHV